MDASRLQVWQVVVATAAGMVGSQVLANGLVVGFVIVMAISTGVSDPDQLMGLMTSFAGIVVAAVPLQIALVATAFATVLLARRPPWRTLGFTPVAWPAFVAAVLAALGSGPLSGTIVWAMRRVVPAVTFDVLALLAEQIEQAPYPALLLVIVVLPGFGEEVFFRGLLQRNLGRSRWAVVVAAVVFSAYHVDPHHAAAAFPLGVVFGWLAWRSGSIWPAIVAHWINNLVAVTVPRLVEADLDAPPSWYLVVAGLAALGAGGLVMRWVPRPVD